MSKMHPDKLAAMISDLAKQHGYAVTNIEFCGLQAMGGALPRHAYGSEPVITRHLDGRVIASSAPMTSMEIDAD